MVNYLAYHLTEDYAEITTAVGTTMVIGHIIDQTRYSVN